MKRSELIKRFRNRTSAKGRVGMEEPVGHRPRKLLMESFEHRLLLAADFLDNSTVENFCTEWTETAPSDLSGTNGFVHNGSSDQWPAGDERLDVDPVKPLPGAGRESEVSLNSLALPASVVGSFAWYGDTAFSGDGVANARDAGKKLVKEGSELQLLSFENLLSNSNGITGMAFEIVNLPGNSLTVSDFQLQVSPLGDYDQALSPPSSWKQAPEPEGIDVSEPDENQERQVSLRWANNAIQNRWLRISILATVNTGLTETEVYYIGHLLGKTNDELANGQRMDSKFFEVGVADALRVRPEVGMMSTASTTWDVNRDGVVSFRDILELRNAYGNRLSIITIPPAGAVAGEPEKHGLLVSNSDKDERSSQGSDKGESPFEDEKSGIDDPVVFFGRDDENQGKSEDRSPPITVQAESDATVVGAFVYHRNSGLSGNGMSSGLDTSKQLMKETSEPQKLGIANLINSSRGLNGLVFDISQLSGESLSPTDFVFQISPTGAFNELSNPAGSWELAPAPEMISVTKDQPLNVSRVGIHWPDNAIVNRWLRVTIKANTNTGLGSDEIYYIGHLQGKNTDWMINFGGWNPSGIYEVHTVDMLAIRQEVGQVVDAGNIYDINKDGVISFKDISDMRSHVGIQLSNITVAGPVAAASSTEKLSHQESLPRDDMYVAEPEKNADTAVEEAADPVAVLADPMDEDIAQVAVVVDSTPVEIEPFKETSIPLEPAVSVWIVDQSEPTETGLPDELQFEYATTVETEPVETEPVVAATLEIDDQPQANVDLQFPVDKEQQLVATQGDDSKGDDSKGDLGEEQVVVFEEEQVHLESRTSVLEFSLPKSLDEVASSAATSDAQITDASVFELMEELQLELEISL